MNKIAKLPKNFVISSKDYGDNPLWPEFINWLSKEYNMYYTGKDEDAYYGRYNNTLHYGNLPYAAAVISIYQWYSAINYVPDFTIPGTKIGDCKGLEYACTGHPYFYNNNILTESFIVYTKKVFINNNEVCVEADKESYKGKNYFIFRLNDLIKNYKKQNQMKKKLLGYKIKPEFINDYILLFKHSAPKDYVLKEKISFEKNSIFYIKARDLKILDAWFDEVYETSPQLPTINGYDGKFNKEEQSIEYGCAKFPFLYLRDIYQNIMRFNNVTKRSPDRYNRIIIYVELSSGVKIGIDKLKDIIRFFDYHEDLAK